MTETVSRPSLRELKKEQTREALQRAAVRLAKDKGVEATTVEEIAHEAGVSPRTFFRYFAAKEDVFFGDEPRLVEVLTRGITERPPEEALVDTLLRLGTEAAQWWESQRDFVVDRYELLAESPTLAQRAFELQPTFVDAIVNALAEVADPAVPVLHLQVLAWTLHGAFNAAFMEWLANEGASGRFAAMWAEAFGVTRPALDAVLEPGRLSPSRARAGGRRRSRSGGQPRG